MPETNSASKSLPDAARPTHGRTIGLLVRGKNISEETLLATDYLNHFNEIIMLLEMVPGMPECFEDAQEWRPKTYQEHFRDSAFADKDLAILAYENAPAHYRVPFDDTVARMNALIAVAMSEIAAALPMDNPGPLEETVGRITSGLRGLVDQASAIIHGDSRTNDQSAVDRLFES